jgi:glycosyltransferase involved in cell wall biosynthesis
MGESRRIRLLMLRAGGWEQWVETVADFLGRNGFEVTVLVARAPRPTLSGPSSFAFAEEPNSPPNCAPGLWESARRLRRQLAKGCYDILYVVDSWSIPVLWLATAGALHWRRTALVYHTFEWIEPNVHGRAWCHLERRLCHRANLVVNIDRIRGRVQQFAYGLHATPLWLRNSLSRDYPVPPFDPEVRQQLLGRDPPPNSVALLCPSVADPERMGRELIRAVASLPHRFRLALIRGQGSYQEECERVAREAGAAERITFLSRMKFDEVMTCIASSDVGIVLHDPGSSSLGNYLANPMRLPMFAACGIPVVASDLPSVAQDVYQYGLGVCCDSRAPASIAAAIEQVTKSSLQQQSRRDGIVAVFRAELSFETRATELQGALTSLVLGARHE